MFDFHLHSKVSFDSNCPSADILIAAEKNSMKEICFTDHYDYNDVKKEEFDIFEIDNYRLEYEALSSEKVKIRHGVEFGLTTWNKENLKQLLNLYDFDFVLGSVHYAGGFDPYFKEFWTHNGLEKGAEKYFLQTLKCVECHDNFDVLGHFNYVSKSDHNPTKKPISYSEYGDICDEIIKVLVQKGKGIEINTSGIDKIGDFLPSIDYIKRFRELGGEIITIGSDAHDAFRVGQYIPQALEIAKEIFGYVCTFEKRNPIFHKL